MTPQRISLITLGTSDMDRARRFYERLGWKAAPSPPEVPFYQLDSLALGLCGLRALAADQGRADATLGTGAITLAQNFSDRAAVDAAWQRALAAGAAPLKAPEEVFWGGYSGYFADPDDHVWEIAHNPFWPIDADGRITLPEAP